jgi:hypothetical protein
MTAGRRPLAIAFLIAPALAFSACRDPAYIDLQIAKDRLPFPKPGVDFDMIGVETRAMHCANTIVKYPPTVLPATLTITPGDCFKDKFKLQAFTLLANNRVAESTWLDLAFPRSGALVATATLADLVIPKRRFRTSFEPNQPIGAGDGVIRVLDGAMIPNLVIKVDEMVASEGHRSIALSGTALSTAAFALAEVAAPEVEVASGDVLSFAMRIDRAMVATIGVDVILEDGTTGKTLGLVDMDRVRIEPSTPKTEPAGSWRKHTVDLSRAASGTIRALIFGFDARSQGHAGDFEAHLDDVLVGEPL